MNDVLETCSHPPPSKLRYLVCRTCGAVVIAGERLADMTPEERLGPTFEERFFEMMQTANERGDLT